MKKEECKESCEKCQDTKIADKNKKSVNAWFNNEDVIYAS